MINVAQIGVGYWGPNLLRNLVTNPDCTIKAVVEISKNRQEYVKKLYPYIYTTDNLDEVLKDREIDALVVATPANTHYELVIKSLTAGKHILVEKPMARSIKEIEIIQSCSEKNNLVAMVGHTFIYNSAVRFLKHYIKNGDLGDLRYIFSQRLNLGRIRSDVDALWNFSPHDISIIQYLLDDPSPISVSKFGMDYVQNGIDDVVFLNIKYPNKIMAHIHVSWLDPSKVRRMTIVGSNKMIVYDDISENKIAIFDKGIDRMARLGESMDYDNINRLQFSYRSGDIVFPKIDYEEPLKTEISHFVDCIENGTACLTGTRHAYNVIKILNDAEKE